MSETYTPLTEANNPATAAIDSLSAREIVALIAAEDARVAPAVAAVGGAIAEVAERAAEGIRRGGRLIYIGAGTSGRLGVLDAAECPPTYSTPPELVVGLIAGGTKALTMAVEAVEDDPANGARDIAAAAVGPHDTVVGIAASGRTPYVLGAVAEARRRGALTAGVTCSHPSPLSEAVDVVIAPLVGPEVIAGSTRMKAGTAQKLVLNSLSTTVMVRLGKTYGNLMVDLQPLNEKLRRRSVNILAAATGLPAERAAAALADAGDLKTALVMTLAGVGADEARARLRAGGGHVRAALAGGQ
ncbi:MAG TPA: N-acetylmuramic acid 6-phosphate etherase [Chloroflexaceae bacterium]|nr:N-acetylmuramic acid 6-phosphate etherase [Chloroflexaceae bacterium]